jgi:Zn-dependent membrane protease YugP
MPQTGLYFDPIYFVFILPAFLLTMYAQGRIRSAFSKWSQVTNSRNATGIDVARTLLPREQMTDVRVEMAPGQLSDHYDPNANILRLSEPIAQQPSIAAMSVAAHEIGHAEQDRDGYLWMKVRSGIVPLVNIGSSLGYMLFIAGLLGQINSLAWLGVILVSAGAVFALVTLPVELDASNRAMRMLQENGFLSSEEERSAARDMLNAAALTYVAGAAQAISTVLYYVFLLMGRSRRRSNY